MLPGRPRSSPRPTRPAATDAAGDAPQPSNTIEEAADEWLAALQSGDCKEIVDATHAQNYPTEETVADPATGDCKGAKTNSAETEIAGSAQFGPVGMVAYKYAPGQYSYDEFIADRDSNDQFKHTTTIYAGPNGLDPAPDGNNADAKIEAFVDAIRANDADALNDSLTVETPPPGEGGFAQTGPFKSIGTDPEYAKQVVSDIRADAEADARPSSAPTRSGRHTCSKRPARTTSCWPPTSPARPTSTGPTPTGCCPPRSADSPGGTGAGGLG